MANGFLGQARNRFLDLRVTHVAEPSVNNLDHLVLYFRAGVAVVRVMERLEDLIDDTVGVGGI